MKISETYVNASEGYQYGESGWYEPYTDNRGQLFRDLLHEYGGCTGKIYRDVPRADSAHSPYPLRPIDTRRESDVIECGWVFRKRMRYEDARGNRDSDFYIREVWVEVKS